MKKRKMPLEWMILLVIVLLVVAISVFEWQKPKTLKEEVSKTISQSSSLKQEKEEGSVTVLVEYLSDKSNNETSVFEISLDTHSVNLDGFNYEREVVLEKEGKSTLSQTVTQEGEGHHRKAIVTFAAADVPFTVVVNNLAGIPRREFLFNNL